MRWVENGLRRSNRSNWAEKIITAEIQGESIGREIAKKLAPPILKSPKIFHFPQPYQNKVVESGESNITVYSLKISSFYVGFIQFVGNNSFDEAYLYWQIDGKLQIDPYVNWQIADVSSPKKLEPWIRFRDKVVWTAKNDSDFACYFEVLMDGIFVPKEDVQLLLGLGLPAGR